MQILCHKIIKYLLTFLPAFNCTILIIIFNFMLNILYLFPTILKYKKYFIKSLSKQTNYYWNFLKYFKINPNSYLLLNEKLLIKKLRKYDLEVHILFLINLESNFLYFLPFQIQLRSLVNIFLIIYKQFHNLFFHKKNLWENAIKFIFI